MSDKNEESKGTGDWHLKRIALVAYAVATAVGMFYGQAYYDHFGIALLDYASPIDLLFIALADLEAIVVAALAVPITFLCLPIVLLLAPFVLEMLFVVIVVVLGCVVLPTCVIFLGTLAFTVAFVRVAALRAYWVLAALAAVIADRRERAKRVRAAADQGAVPKAAERPLRLTVAYKKASQHVPDWKIIDPQTYVRFARNPLLESLGRIMQWGKTRLLSIRSRVRRIFVGIRSAYSSFEAKKESEKGRRRFKSWQTIDLGPRFMLVFLVLTLLVYALFATSRLGTFYAEKLLSEAHGTKSLIGFWDVMLESQSKLHNARNAALLPKAVFVIPTENLASLDFFELPKEDRPKAPSIRSRQLPTGRRRRLATRHPRVPATPGERRKVAVPSGHQEWWSA